MAPGVLGQYHQHAQPIVEVGLSLEVGRARNHNWAEENVLDPPKTNKSAILKTVIQVKLTQYGTNATADI